MDSPKQTLMSLVVASAQRSLTRMFPGLIQGSPKHNHWYDFGFPENITFAQFYTMYKRNGLARAGIVRPVEKSWQDNPWILENEDVHDETKLEKDIRLAFERVQFWHKLKEADERARVGKYGGVIFRFADNQLMNQAVTRVPGGLEGLVEIIPVFEEQLQVSEFDTDERSLTYGQPKMFQFNESAVALGQKNNRSFTVHPDRVHIWSKDFSVHGDSALEPGFNDLLTIEKVIGAGGEGFWKNAKSSPVLNMDKDANPQNLAAMLGTDIAGIADKMDQVVEDWQKGFDQLLMLQGIDTKVLPVTLPLPEQYFLVALRSYAASIPIPEKILLGSQSGERASTEDAKEWAQTCQTRRQQHIIPNIRRIVEKLVKFKVLPEKDWHIDFSDLTESSMDEKIGRAEKMSTINRNLMGTGELAFTSEEIREVVGMEPNDDLGEDLEDDLPEDDLEDDEAA